MKISYLNIIKIALGAYWTQRGGRKRIKAQQLRNLRRLVEKVRRQSPLFAELYEHVPPSDAVQLQDLPITRKPELMIQFDRWLTDRTLTRARVLEHMEDINNLGVPINDLLVFRTSGSSGEPLIVASPI
jgi:phenylacetate-coenzyme A ligase PaaK-like adenylate-forming protein